MSFFVFITSKLLKVPDESHQAPSAWDLVHLRNWCHDSARKWRSEGMNLSVGATCKHKLEDYYGHVYRET